VTIEKLAEACVLVRSEFLDLDYTGKSINLVSLVIAKLARDIRGKVWQASQSGH
jgi:hypothetical protein